MDEPKTALQQEIIEIISENRLTYGGCLLHKKDVDAMQERLLSAVDKGAK